MTEALYSGSQYGSGGGCWGRGAPGRPRLGPLPGSRPLPPLPARPAGRRSQGTPESAAPRRVRHEGEGPQEEGQDLGRGRPDGTWGLRPRGVRACGPPLRAGRLVLRGRPLPGPAESPCGGGGGRGGLGSGCVRGSPGCWPGRAAPGSGRSSGAGLLAGCLMFQAHVYTEMLVGEGLSLRIYKMP